jgi:transcriptional regulator with XRE-family HTH domain
MSEQEKKSGPGVPNSNLLPILTFCCCKKTFGTGAQAELADLLGVSPGLIARLKNGERNWTDELIDKAHKVLAAKKPAVQLSDLYEQDAIKLVEKLSLDTQSYHRLLVMLTPPKGGWQPYANEDLRELIGNYVGVYLCVDPNAPDQLGVAMDGFVFEKCNRPDHLTVEQTNYALDDENDVVPTGTLQLRRNIIEIDIDYRNLKYPQGKYLAFRPEQNVEGKHNFVATTLNVKVKSKLVVARPVLFVQIAEVLTEWRIFPKSSSLFQAVTNFLKANAQFELSNFELCPNPNAKSSEWRPVIEKVNAAIANLHQPV